MNDNKKMTFSDFGRRKSELKLELVRKETEIRIGFESFVSSLDPVKILDRLWTDVSSRLDPITRIITLFLSLFGGRRTRRKKYTK